MNLQVRKFIICNAYQLKESNVECFNYHAKTYRKYLNNRNTETKSYEQFLEAGFQPGLEKWGPEQINSF